MLGLEKAQHRGHGDAEDTETEWRERMLAQGTDEAATGPDGVTPTEAQRAVTGWIARHFQVEQRLGVDGELQPAAAAVN